ncbi:FkbM family methyltransferase, partial [bacterium]|nr:FkbM family methyltransferase [bacterium]
IVDVGANIGQYAHFLRSRVRYKGLIISFEPDPDNLAQLQIAAEKDNNWLIFGCALGNERTTLDMNIMEHSVLNSFLKPDHSQTNQFRGKNEIKKTLKVEVKRLDELLPSLRDKYNFSNVYLKLDTQGFDLNVFAGALGVINQISAVQSEVSFIPIYKSMPTLEQSLNVFKAEGFEVSALYAVEEDRFPFAVEFDCIFLKDKL